MQLLLILMALLLPPGAGAEEIIGGREARPHSHPYMAYLLIQTPRGDFTCGGFLVREDFVMTSAQCWGRATRHPGYNEENNLNDIMLLQLENRAGQNQFVRPVALPQSRTEPRPGSRCTVAGWGLVSQNRRTDTLRDVQLSVQRDQVCSNLFNTCNGQKQICVRDQSDVETAFKGDSGGPLVCNNVAQGIVSYGRSFGALPTVFTRIARFLPWINNTMRQFEHKGSH